MIEKDEDFDRFMAGLRRMTDLLVLRKENSGTLPVVDDDCEISRECFMVVDYPCCGTQPVIGFYDPDDAVWRGVNMGGMCVDIEPE